ncbi:NIPSNAP family protein [Aquabacterium sp. J223]|uniref:NIPSNAP family protein n=1 Tax=Aquabacterium sp. J223 TaxID=2898431 RepID=UPI0021AE2A61|nr:NIPSNAP family protein [Aquabacterium sp. J223]UUX95350.1 NIPSNAP family protein [Aquabacterium sp. J223]
MLVEQRIYELKVGAAHEFLRAYEAEGLAVQTGALGRLLGYFVSEVGELNRVVQLWGFDSFEDRLQRRATLSADPAWRAFLSKVGHLVIDQRNELLIPAPFSPLK